MVNDAEKARFERINSEMLDSFDEELEMEIDDDRLDKLLEEFPSGPTRTDGSSAYFKELFRLQGELVKLQDWVVAQKLKFVVIFEGRDAAGKGGVIKRITQRLNPRVCRVAALPAPNERERTQWYFQRYVTHLPAAAKSSSSTAAGTIAPASSASWASAPKRNARNFCAPCRSSSDAGPFGNRAIKYWFSITDEEQHFRFMMRIHDPLKQWKLSPDGSGVTAPWEAYTKAKEAMLEGTHIPEAPWWIVEAVDKKKARLNCIPTPAAPNPLQVRAPEPIALPGRVHNPEYHRGPIPKDMYVPDVY